MDTIHLEEVEICHDRPVQRVPFISGEADSLPMELMAGRSLAELLACQPAVLIKSAGRGALSTASFRGTDASHTKVYWNGIRLNSPMLGQVDFSLLPVWITDELSLLYGGSSLREGSGALGGAVIMENTVDWKESLKLSLHQELASFRTLGSALSLETGDDRLRSRTRLFTLRSRNNHPFLNTDVLPVVVQQLEGSAYRRGGILQEICIRPGNRQELSIRLWYQESQRDLPPLMSQEGADREERQSENNLRTSLEWKAYPGFGTLTLRSAYAGTSMHYFLQHNEPGYRQFDSESRENSVYNTLKADLNAGSRSSIQLRTDLNLHDAGILDLVTQNGYDHRRKELSFLVSAYRKAGERWTLYALVREERADGHWLPVMPSAGFRYSMPAGRAIEVKGNLSRNYNLPSLNDLYWIPGGNPDLRPEKSLNADLSLDIKGKETRLLWLASFHAFAARVEDWILWKPTQFRYWEPGNLGRVFSRGVDARAGADLTLGDCLLTLSLSYAFTRSTSQGEQLIYIPVHTAYAYLNLDRKGYFLNWTLNRTGRRYVQPGYEEQEYRESLNPYALHDLYLGKSWKIRKGRGGLRFTVYNLFNVSYQAIRSRPMPMRNYALTLHFEL